MDDTRAMRNSELRAALRKLTLGDGVQRGDILEALQGELLLLQRHWSVNLTNGPGVAQDTIASNLRAHISKLVPRPARQPLSPGSRQLQYKHAIDVCFNATRRPELKGKDLTQRQRWLAHDARGSLRIDDRTCRRDLVDALDQIEQQILKSGSESANVAAAPPTSTDGSLGESPQSKGRPALSSLQHGPVSPYIPRLAIDKQFSHFLDIEIAESRWQRANTICLVGEPGTGKSRYVTELLATSAATWINGESVDALSSSLADALEPSDVPVASLDTPGLKREFAKLLARSDAPRLVVIDGIHDPQEVDSFVPRSTRTRLIITSRTRPTDDWAPVLHVGEMTADEATAMASSLLPAADDREATDLAASLGYRPLVIEQACAFLNRNSSFTTADLIGSFTRDAAGTLQSLPNRPNAALTVIYRKMLATLQKDYPTSHLLLEMMALLPPLYVPRNFVMGFLAQRLPIEESERARYELNYIAATAPLRELCLLKETSLGIRIDALTQELLRDLLWPDIEDIMDRFDTTVNRKGMDEFKLDSIGWPPREIASLCVIEELFYPRVFEQIAVKMPPSRADEIPGKRDKLLSAEEWSALAEALWERVFRAYLAFEIISDDSGKSFDEIVAWLHPYMEEIDQLASRIPNRSEWQARVGAFEPDEFMNWLATNDTLDRVNIIARLRDDYERELKILIKVYVLQHAFDMHLSDPTVETRLGQFDLRELNTPRITTE